MRFNLLVNGGWRPVSDRLMGHGCCIALLDRDVDRVDMSPGYREHRTQCFKIAIMAISGGNRVLEYERFARDNGDHYSYRLVLCRVTGAGVLCYGADGGYL